MGDIAIPVSYTSEIAKIIRSISGSPGFQAKDWGGPDLLPVRKFIRDYYAAAQNGRCAYCRSSLSGSSALNCHVEHIVPKSKYLAFIFEPKNLCVVCAECDAIKRAQEVSAAEPDPLKKGEISRYPRSSEAFLIVHPHFDLYSKHIDIFGLCYIDKTEKGSFTINACGLNRRLYRNGWDAPFIDDDAISTAAREIIEAKDAVALRSAISKMRRLMNFY